MAKTIYAIMWNSNSVSPIYKTLYTSKKKAICVSEKLNSRISWFRKRLLAERWYVTKLSLEE